MPLIVAKLFLIGVVLILLLFHRSIHFYESRIAIRFAFVFRKEFSFKDIKSITFSSGGIFEGDTIKFSLSKKSIWSIGLSFPQRNYDALNEAVNLIKLSNSKILVIR